MCMCCKNKKRTSETHCRGSWQMGFWPVDTLEGIDSSSVVSGFFVIILQEAVMNS